MGERYARLIFALFGVTATSRALISAANWIDRSKETKLDRASKALLLYMSRK
jgi:hypothetical protein